MPNTSLTMCIQVFGWTDASFSPWSISRSTMVGSYISWTFKFLRNCQTMFQSGFNVFWLLHIFTKMWFFLYCSHSSTSIVVPQGGLLYISLWLIIAIFHMLIYLLCTFYGELIVQIFILDRLPSEYWVVGVLTVVWMEVLSHIYVLQVFSASLWLPFHFLLSCFGIFVKYHWPGAKVELLGREYKCPAVRWINSVALITT